MLKENQSGVQMSLLFDLLMKTFLMVVDGIMEERESFA
jgi:hypothetical protein